VDASNSDIRIQRAGLVEYLDGWKMQRDIHSAIVDGRGPNTLVLLEHPSVYTAGRRTLEIEKPMDGTPVVDVDRGGKITWHGPGQIVGYPIVKLKNRNEVVGFVREIESALIDALAECGISSEQFCERSGVWIRDAKGDRKIAAIGIRVAKGVTMHGFALNVNPDLGAFTRIIPCGIADADVTSMARELGRSVTIEEIAPIVERHIIRALKRVAA
jgi:lipoyl(octanoyl) transferase